MPSFGRFDGGALGGGEGGSQSGGVADSTYTIDQRDTSGRWSLMTYGGTQYAATYNAFGTYSTITGGGKTLTYSYDAAGRLTGMTAA
jgi:YD repeat-containing protein